MEKNVFLGFDHFSLRGPPVAHCTGLRVGSESLGSVIYKNNTHPADIEVRYQFVLPIQLPAATLEAPIVCATQLNMKVT
jgi:hypothetical protein